MTGTVIYGINNLFTVQVEEDLRLLCGIKGKILEASIGFYNPLAPGDVVCIEPDPLGGGKGLIVDLIKRKNAFCRWNEKGRSLQVLAANIDLLVCVVSAQSPPFRPRFIDRMLVMAERESIPALILLNKCELETDEDTEERLEDYKRLGYLVLRCSATTGDGIRELSQVLKGKKVAFAGQSGVGKSSVLNALNPNLKRRVGELSAKYNRGAHTTNFACLGRLSDDDDSSLVIDTPGVRRLSVKGLEPGELAGLFPEFKELVLQCSYGLSCTHEQEPGCKVLEAVYSGYIHEDRYESFLRMRSELQEDG